ncbi:MAG: lipopolysaccharide biosynthesis protein [Pyrinomonadaceae bacterium]|nr:lipopolysaccharide biosynthesis protein [Sphingobacteriaceae bacterium]
MELAHFFKFLSKNLGVLILIPVVTVLITYFLVKNLPDKFISEGQVSTGIVDKSDEIDLTDAPPLQQSEIEQKFSNLIQLMQMERILSLVSYQLVIHDLKSPKPYKALTGKLEDLSPKEKNDIIALAQNRYAARRVLSRLDPNDVILDDVIKTMKYNPASIREFINIKRIGQSDFISITFESTDPDLSAFTINRICEEFINDYTNTIKNTGARSVTFLSKLLGTKHDALNDKMNILKYYKITNGVLNLPEQARILYGQMVTIQDRQADVQKQIVSIQGAIKAIDNKFNARDRQYLEASSSKINAEIVAYTEKSKALTDKYIDNDFDPVYKRMIDSMAILTNNKINQASDDFIYNPMFTKQDLIAKKIGLQTELDIAKNSVSSLERFHNNLFNQFSRLVPFEATIQSYERDIEIASQEYLETLNKYNNTSLQTTFIAKLKLSQRAAPGALQASKKMLLIILSGVISFVFCVLVLFALFYFDDAIQSAKQLADKTELPVIGQLDYMSSSSLNIKNLWENTSDKSEFKDFKDQLRAIRLELNQELGGSKILAVTSFGAGEGKTFLSLNIAYAYAVTNKKILLIDGNFIHSELTNSIKPENLIYIEDFLLGGELNQNMESKTGITIMGNKGGDKSVFEITNEENTKEKLEYLKSIFDIILIETPALVTTETAKEWVLFAEKLIGVFEYKEYITESKKAQLNYIKSIGPKFIGWVFNKVATNVAKKKSWF